MSAFSETSSPTYGMIGSPALNCFVANTPNPTLLLTNFFCCEINLNWKRNRLSTALHLHKKSTIKGIIYFFLFLYLSVGNQSQQYLEKWRYYNLGPWHQGINKSLDDRWSPGRECLRWFVITLYTHHIRKFHWRKKQTCTSTEQNKTYFTDCAIAPWQQLYNFNCTFSKIGGRNFKKFEKIEINVF